MSFFRIKNLGSRFSDLKTSGRTTLDAFEGADKVCIIVETRQNTGLFHRMTEIQKLFCLGDLAKDYVVVKGNARFRLENLVQVVLVYVKACGNAQNADLSEIFFNISQRLVRPAFGDGAFVITGAAAKFRAGKGEYLEKF